ncbi:macro domain-containing protein [Bacillus zanthoxyli]|nr:macro domain-containing protein [Bacillus zanthoxyli]
MITYVKTDLFESPAQVLVNTVNTVGVMGKGIAKRFKQTYPEMFTQYQKYCEHKVLDVGKLWIYKSPHKWVLNFPTKKHWRQPSKLVYIESGLKKFVATYQDKGITSISFPLLGCGNGGLDWESEVKPLMEKYLRPLPIEVFIHLNGNKSKPEHKEVSSTKKWLQSMPEFLSFNEVWDDLHNKILFDDEIVYKGEKWKMSLLNIQNDITASLNEETSENIDKDPTIEFLNENDDERYYATVTQLHGLWRYLRKMGFCIEKDLPEGLSELGGLILHLMNKLDYIEPVEIAYKYDDDDDFQMGIRVIPYKVNSIGKSGKGETLNAAIEER